MLPDNTLSGDASLPVVPEPGQLDSNQLALRRLTRAVRAIQDRVVGLEAPTDVVVDTASALERLAVEIEPYRVDPDREPSWDDLARTANTRILNPVLIKDSVENGRLHGRVTFTQFYAGANGAVHGGALPMFFDEALAQLANIGGLTRTAFLKVDYRKVTPIGKELRVEAWLDRVEGRKRFVNGALYHGDDVTAEATSLFVALRPGAA
ncbi:PaaI family thioesterase [Jatrophihabitans sp. DSM 45814]